MSKLYTKYNDYYKAYEFINFKLNKYGLSLTDDNSPKYLSFYLETCNESTSTLHVCDIPVVRFLANHFIFPIHWNYQCYSDINERHTRKIFYDIKEISNVAECLVGYKEKINKKTNKKHINTTEIQNKFII